MFREVVVNTEVNVESEESEAQGLMPLLARSPGDEPASEPKRIGRSFGRKPGARGIPEAKGRRYFKGESCHLLLLHQDED